MMSSLGHEIKKVYLAQDAAEDELTHKVLARLKEVEVVDWQGEGDPLRAQADSSAGSGNDAAEVVNSGKKSLVLSRYKGAWVKRCPGTQGHVCCNLWVINPGEGCPLDCTYCILQDYLKRNPSNKIFTNTEEMKAAIKELTSSQPERLFRICTGEFTDSLVWDDLTDLSLELVPLFASLQNAVLELKTKTVNIANLRKLGPAHKGHTIVSWSVNAKSVSENDEAYAASLEERLCAAKEMSELGYRVGFHFDPVVYFEGWQNEYRETIRRIFEHVRPEAVAWVSISSLRYKKDLQEMMRARFPQSKLPFGEQFLAKDYKIRYIQPLRLKLLRFMWRELKSIYPALPVYMCMESPTLWKEITGGMPRADSELQDIFSRQKS